MNRFWIVLLCLLLPFSLQASDHTVISGNYKTPVVELYTSEGCSSCPSADKWLGALNVSVGDDLKVIPLAFHVDYWDSIGWKDPFAKSSFTARQKNLARVNQQATVYTPEFIVDGAETRRKAQIMKQLIRANAEPAEAKISLHVSLNATEIKARVSVTELDASRKEAANLFLAVYENNLSREIMAGENAGKKLHHNHVVREWVGPIKVGQSSIKNKPFTLRIGADWNKDQLGIAAIVKTAKAGKTLQAVNLTF